MIMIMIMIMMMMMMRRRRSGSDTFPLDPQRSLMSSSGVLTRSFCMLLLILSIRSFFLPLVLRPLFRSSISSWKIVMLFRLVSLSSSSCSGCQLPKETETVSSSPLLPFPPLLPLHLTHFLISLLFPSSSPSSLLFGPPSRHGHGSANSCALLLGRRAMEGLEGELELVLVKVAEKVLLQDLLTSQSRTSSPCSSTSSLMK